MDGPLIVGCTYMISWLMRWKNTFDNFKLSNKPFFYFSEKNCSDISIVENGVISAPGGYFKDTVVLQCQPGYSLDGPSTIWCQADGRWSTEFGTCENKGGAPKML